MPRRDALDPVTAAPGASVERPWWGPVAIVAFVALVICSNVASAVWGGWIDDKPEAVLALSSRNRYLALSIAAGVSGLAYIAIATARLASAYAVCHLIGRAYRQDTYRWFSRYLGVDRESIRSFERGFHRAQWVLVPFFVGSNIIAVITGVHRTPPHRLAAMLAVGIAARLALFWWLAHAFEEWLLDILDLVTRYQWWVIGGSIAIVVLVNLKNLRTGSGG